MQLETSRLPFSVSLLVSHHQVLRHGLSCMEFGSRARWKTRLCKEQLFLVGRFLLLFQCHVSLVQLLFDVFPVILDCSNKDISAAVQKTLLLLHYLWVHPEASLYKGLGYRVIRNDQRLSWELLQERDWYCVYLARGLLRRR